MGMPRKLKGFNLFQNGENFVGQVTEVTLPKLTRKMEDWQGGGMSGPAFFCADTSRSGPGAEVSLGSAGGTIGHRGSASGGNRKVSTMYAGIATKV